MNQREKKRRQKLQSKRWREAHKEEANYASYRSMAKKFARELSNVNDIYELQKIVEAREAYFKQLEATHDPSLKKWL